METLEIKIKMAFSGMDEAPADKAFEDYAQSVVNKVIDALRYQYNAGDGLTPDDDEDLTPDVGLTLDEVTIESTFTETQEVEL